MYNKFSLILILIVAAVHVQGNPKEMKDIMADTEHNIQEAMKGLHTVNQQLSQKFHTTSQKALSDVKGVGEHVVERIKSVGNGGNTVMTKTITHTSSHFP